MAVMKRSSLLLFLALVLSACSDASAPVKSGPPAALAVVSGSEQEGRAGDPLSQPLVLKVTDAQGLPVARTAVFFVAVEGGGTFSSSVATTNNQGEATTTWTLGPRAGNARAEARVTGVTASAVFNAVIKPGAASAAIRVSEAPGTSAAGYAIGDSVAVRITDRFGNAVAGAPVTFSVTAGGGTVSVANRVTDNDGIARTAWTLGSAGPQTLRAASGSIEVLVNGTAAACTELQMSVGSAVTLAPGATPCIILNGSAQQYIVTIANATNAASAALPFRFRAVGTGTAGVLQADAPTHASDAAARAASRSHALVMKANADLLGRLGSPRTDELARITQAAPPPNVGDTIALNIPSFADLCSVPQAAKVKGRVVYVGSRGVVLEDIQSPTARQYDDLYTAVGREFDESMFPILSNNFGDPLALDAQLDADGRVFMLFSKVVNDALNGGIAGFVSSGDLYPQTACAASNKREVFYARVPTKVGTGIDTDNSTQTGDEWQRSVRTVIIHEVTHVTSFAEKIARGWNQSADFNNKNSWLEESTAMLAEEMWGRAVFGYTQRGNTNYRSSVFCEIRPQPQHFGVCPPPIKPVTMLDHFYYLGEFESSTESRSIVGSTANDDFSFYGSGWMFLRWVIDTYGGTEAQFIKQIVRESVLPGAQSVEARAGKPFAELLAGWSLAVALDDRPDFTPADPRFSLASWNTRDIFAGLNTDFSNTSFFPKAVPLAARTIGFGNARIDVASVRGGSFSVLDISGTQEGKQLFEFRGAGGAGLSSDVRVSVARVR